MGCQSSFDRFVQGRIQIQLTQKEKSGECSVETDQSNVVTEDLSSLCWNLHLGIRSQSTIMLICSPDTTNILNTVKATMSSLKASHQPLSSSTLVTQEPNHEIKELLPIRWRLDCSLLDCVLVIPGKNVSTSVHASNSMRVCIQPDPLKTGNISIDITSRSHLLLNNSIDIVEPFTLSCGVMAAPDLFKIQHLNTELGSLDAPPLLWKMEGTAAHVHLIDGLDISVSASASPIKANLPTQLFAFLKGVQQMHKISKVNNRHAQRKSITTTKQKYASINMIIPSVSVKLNNNINDSVLEALIEMKEVSVRFVTDAKQTSTDIGTGDFGLFFTEGSSTFPVLYTKMSGTDKKHQALPALLFSAKISKCFDTELLKISVSTGESYMTLVPSFIKRSNRFISFVKNGGRKEGSGSGGASNPINLAGKLRCLGFVISVNASLDSFNLVLPSQDIPSFCYEREETLQAISLKWKNGGISLSLNASQEIMDVDIVRTSSISIEGNLDKEIEADGSFSSFKVDINANLCLMRSEYILRARDESNLVILPCIFQMTTEQTIISPFSYGISASLITSSSKSIYCSLGLHLDVGEIDVIWHVTKSMFGFSKALDVSVIPLFKSNKPNHSVSTQEFFGSMSLLTSPIQQDTNQIEAADTELKVPDEIYLFLKDTMVVSSA